ncbi:SRPBCC family protein [Nocardia sp. NPDC051463]|uniref:SRPBCC family protein n=1 Tax=Nocardia sp. NPDC051463 TaxID=3154845 RepID=UPI003415037C
MSPRIRRAESTLTQVVPAPPAEVRAFYRDLSRLGEVHPLIVGVEQLPDTEEHGVRSSNYRVTDRIPFGPWSYRITYRVRSRTAEHGDLLVDAYQFPRIHVQTRASFTEHTSGTTVVEQLRLTAPWPLLSTVRSLGVRAHVTMLDNLRKRFKPTGADI